MNQTGLLKSLSFGCFIWLALSGTLGCSGRAGDESKTIKVGILHSLSGTMAASEIPVKEVTLMAIEEINEQGGLLGKRLVPVVVDGKSDWPTFAREAERLIGSEKVSVVFGCWTSASRKMVKPVFEKFDHMLFYPVQYEGLEESPNIFYTGAAPNQQITPAVKWCFDNLGKKFFLVGSDYVFPRVANELIKNQLQVLGGSLAGEEYVLLGSNDFNSIAQKIAATKPDVILNTVNGSSNIAFLKALQTSNITSNKIPLFSFSLAEVELQEIISGDRVGLNKNPVENEGRLSKHLAGNYACWNYFQSISSNANRGFVQRFKQKYGQDRVVDDPMEAAYIGVVLWSKAVKKAGTTETKAVHHVLNHLSFPAPEGIVTIDGPTNHLWKTVRIGKVNLNGQFDMIWSSEGAIKPKPYPDYRSRAEWNRFLNSLFEKWGGRWANPGIGEK
jgi:urea transport system substrate-binding protein